MKIYDISRPLNDSAPVWPGDEPYRFSRKLSIADGASVNLGSISLSVHAGSHADAPLHFLDGGAGIDAMGLSVYIGPAAVIDVSGHATITVEIIESVDFGDSARLLLRTGGWPEANEFPSEFPVIAHDVPAYLWSRGIVLLGLDVPSVDLFDSKDLPNHHALYRHGIHILEALQLQEVPPGPYELIALPLRLEGADGSPVRAILRTME